MAVLGRGAVSYERGNPVVRCLRLAPRPLEDHAPSLDYRGTSLIRNRIPLVPYCRPMSRVLGGSKKGGRFSMCEVPL